MIEPLAEQPGIPYISIRAETGVEIKKVRHKGQPDFGDTIGGRPYLTADLGTSLTPEAIADLYKEYHDILPELSYKEAMALCRSLNYTHSTFLMRRYKHRKAKLSEVILVVSWYRAGKPVIVNKHKLSEASLFGLPLIAE